MTPIWLQFLLAGCGLAITAVTLLLSAGRVGGDERARLTIVEKEVERLRSWRHDMINVQQSLVVMDVFSQRLDRLERRVFNGPVK